MERTSGRRRRRDLAEDVDDDDVSISALRRRAASGLVDVGASSSSAPSSLFASSPKTETSEVSDSPERRRRLWRDAVDEHVAHFGVGLSTSYLEGIVSR